LLGCFPEGPPPGLAHPWAQPPTLLRWRSHRKPLRETTQQFHARLILFIAMLTSLLLSRVFRSTLSGFGDICGKFWKKKAHLCELFYFFRKEIEGLFYVSPAIFVRNLRSDSDLFSRSGNNSGIFSTHGRAGKCIKRTERLNCGSSLGGTSMGLRRRSIRRFEPMDGRARRRSAKGTPTSQTFCE
jgi:hypothetical protein